MKSSLEYSHADHIETLSDLVEINHFDWIDYDSSNKSLFNKMTLASNGNWTFIGANETIDSVCVYNIIPDQCSKCQDQAFCRYADLGFSYLLFLSII